MRRYRGLKFLFDEVKDKEDLLSLHKYIYSYINEEDFEIALALMLHPSWGLKELAEWTKKSKEWVRLKLLDILAGFIRYKKGQRWFIEDFNSGYFVVKKYIEMNNNKLSRLKSTDRKLKISVDTGIPVSVVSTVIRDIQEKERDRKRTVIMV